MSIEQHKLLETLQELNLTAMRSLEGFKKQSLEIINFKSSPEEWSVLECLEHLNLYGDFYLPEIERRIIEADKASPNEIFKPGWIGNYFVKVIKAGNGKKMKAVKPMTPTQSALSSLTIDRHIKQNRRMQELLDQAQKINLSSVKTAISLTSLVKIKLGDTLRFMIYHNERHILQAEKALGRAIEAQKSSPMV